MMYFRAVKERSDINIEILASDILPPDLKTKLIAANEV